VGETSEYDGDLDEGKLFLLDLCCRRRRRDNRGPHQLTCEKGGGRLVVTNFDAEGVRKKKPSPNAAHQNEARGGRLSARFALVERILGGGGGASTGVAEGMFVLGGLAPKSGGVGGKVLVLAGAGILWAQIPTFCVLG